MRRGAAIGLILDRGRENRSQLVFTIARGRDVVFWQSPHTRKQARPGLVSSLLDGTLRYAVAELAALPRRRS